MYIVPWKIMEFSIFGLEEIQGLIIQILSVWYLYYRNEVKYIVSEELNLHKAVLKSLILFYVLNWSKSQTHLFEFWWCGMGKTLTTHQLEQTADTVRTRDDQIFISVRSTCCVLIKYEYTSIIIIIIVQIQAVWMSLFLSTFSPWWHEERETNYKSQC